MPATMRSCALAVVCVVAMMAVGVRADDSYEYLSMNLQWPYSNGCTDDCHPIFTIHGRLPAHLGALQRCECARPPWSLDVPIYASDCLLAMLRVVV